jgi:hypothetical protein
LEKEMKMRKTAAIIACFTVLTAILVIFPIIVEPVKAAEQVTIVNHQGFVDFGGFYNVVGEVKNTGDTPAYNVGVKITFMSPDGADEDEVSVQLNTVLPGRKSPFFATASAAGSTVSSYTIQLSDLTMAGEDMPKVLTITSASSEQNVINHIIINGKVKNSGTQTSTYTRVYATVYDGPSGTGNVVAVTSCTAQPYNAEPGQTSDFQMGFFLTSGKTYASYVLVAESDQYAADIEYVATIGQSSSASPSVTAPPTSSATSTSPSTTSSISPSGTATSTATINPSASPNTSATPAGTGSTEFPTTYVVVGAVAAVAVVAGAGFWFFKIKPGHLPPPPT